MQHKLALLVGTALLGGCAVGPEYKPPEASLPAQWQTASTATIANPIEIEWWKQFNDAALSTLVERALANNGDLQIATLRVAQSRAQRRAVHGSQWPSVNANAGYQRDRQSENGVSTRVIDLIAPAESRDQIISLLSEPYDVYQAGFDVAWELDLWGRVRRSIESADASLAASQEDLHDAQLSLIAEVVRTYFELRGVQDQLRIAKADVAAGQDLVELTQYRVKGGIVDELDLSIQRARLADTRASVPTLEQQAALLTSALSVLVNVEPGSLDAQLASAATSALSRPTAIASGVPSEVARRRPDIRRAEAQLHAATAEIGVAVADLYPRFTLTGNFMQQSLDSSDLLEWSSRQWSIGPSISLPLFDGGRRRSVVEIRKLQQQQAAVSYQQTVLRAWHEIENALRAYTAEQQRYSELTAALVASREAYDIAHVRYSHGLVNYLIELDARRTLLQTERAVSDSNTRLGTHVVAIYKALGGGWEQVRTP